MKKRKIKFIVDRVVERVDETDGKLRSTIVVSPFLENPAEKDRPPVFETVDKILACIGLTPPTCGSIPLKSLYPWPLSCHPWPRSVHRLRNPQKLSLPRLLILSFVGDPGRVPINRH